MFCFFLRSLPFSLCSCGCLENGGCRRFPETLPPLFRSRHRSLIQKWLLQKKQKKRKCYLWVHIIFWRCAHFFFWSLLALRVVDLDAGRLFFWEHRWHICVKRDSDWDFKSEVLQFHPEKPSAGSLSSLVWIWPGPVTALSMEREVCLRLIGEATYRRRSCPLINNMRNVNEHIRATATQITTGCNQDFFFFLFTHNTEY